ncbi:MAG: hypothetical protein WC712_12880 [Candidatus Brocadiia bacterium]
MNKAQWTTVAYAAAIFVATLFFMPWRVWLEYDQTLGNNVEVAPIWAGKGDYVIDIWPMILTWAALLGATYIMVRIFHTRKVD